MSETCSIGIDFGTTKTIVAYVDPQTGIPATAHLGQGGAYIPSSVYVESPDDMLFGDEAETAMEDDGSRYCRGFKMLLGNPAPAIYVQEDCVAYEAKELTAAFLRYIREQCEESVAALDGMRITKAVLTYPAHFSLDQKDELEQAALDAGFQEVELVSAPEAAAYALCTLSPQAAFTGSAVVADWGGGALELSLVSRSADGGRVTVVPGLSEWSNDMGGDQLDSLLFEDIRQKIKERDGVELERNAALLKKVRQYKEALSQKDKVAARFGGTGVRNPLEVTRADFEGLISRELDLAATLARRLVSSIPSGADRPQLMLQMGGMGEMAGIKSVLENAFSMPCLEWKHSRDAAAFGAALLAAAAPAPAAQEEVTAPASPVVPAAPVPVVPAAPVPVVPEAPAPVVPAAPVPVVSATPIPVVPATPIPVVPATPIPVVPAAPAPVVPAAPIPVVPAVPVPVVPAEPEPEVPAEPAPRPRRKTSSSRQQRSTVAPAQPAPQPQPRQPQSDVPSRTTYRWLAFLFGGLGFHNFYAGRHTQGGIQLCLILFSGGFLGFVSWPWAILELLAVEKDGKGRTFRP